MNVFTTELFSRPTHEFILENGQRVIVHEDHRTAEACLTLQYKVDSDDEHPHQKGINEAVLDAMYSYDDETIEQLPNVGGRETGFDGIVLPREHLEMAFEAKSSFMRQVLQEDVLRRHLEIWRFGKKKNTIPPTLRFGFNHQLEMLADKGRSHYLPPAGAAEGTEPTLEQLQSWHQDWYGPNNSVLVVSGDVSIDEVKRLAEKYFGEIARHGSPNRATQVLTVPELGYRQITAQQDIPQPMLQVIFNIPGLETTTAPQAASALQLMTELFTRSAPARLLKLDPNLPSMVARSRYGRGDGMLGFALGYTLQPDEIEDHMWTILERIKQTPFTCDEIEPAIKIFSAALQNTMDTVTGQSLLISRVATRDYPLELLELEITRIKSVTPEDIQKAAITYLTRERASLAHIFPMKSDLG
ncbi:zinc protease [Pseudomonas lini]|uniref:M16 family metallopeptidase n=1 Tax=Pseudomonas lini TaxID=163011 RepID=UPI0027879617|nr:insulinase family protein [Pseudomonas lini]MDQ0126300.1 zinc protease [Pseudomonas lini]